MTNFEWIPVLFVAAMTLATIGLGIYATRKAQTASDFFVAGRSVSVFWNASAISGEYLSAASFMGIAGLVMKNGYDALWYPACFAAGYLFSLAFHRGAASTVRGLYDSRLRRRAVRQPRIPQGRGDFRPLHRPLLHDAAVARRGADDELDPRLAVLGGNRGRRHGHHVQRRSRRHERNHVRPGVFNTGPRSSPSRCRSSFWRPFTGIIRRTWR